METDIPQGSGAGLLSKLGSKLKLPRKISRKSLPKPENEMPEPIAPNLTLKLKVTGEGIKEKVSMPCPPLEEFKTLANLREFVHESVFRVVANVNEGLVDEVSFFFTRKNIRVSSNQEIMKGPAFALVADGNNGFKVTVNLTSKEMERTLSSASSASTMIDDEGSAASLQPIPESVHMEGPLWVLTREGVFEERYCNLGSNLILQSLPLVQDGKVIPPPPTGTKRMSKKKSLANLARKPSTKSQKGAYSPEPRAEADMSAIHRVLPANSQSYTSAPDDAVGVIELIGARRGSRSNRVVVAVPTMAEMTKWLTRFQLASGNPVVSYQKDTQTGMFKPLRHSSATSTASSGKTLRPKSSSRSITRKNSASTLSGNWDRPIRSPGSSGALRPLSAALMNDEHSPKFIPREEYVCL